MSPDDGGEPADFTVLVGTDHLDRVNDVADRLRASGMRVSAVHRETGVITGAALRESIDAIRQLPGVAAVEPGGTYQLPPPESDLQ